MPALEAPLGQAECRVVSGGRCWILRYGLHRSRARGGRAAIWLRCCAREDGCGVAEHAAVDLGPDVRQALRLFRRVVAGAAFPAHLRDVVADVRAAGGGAPLPGAAGPVASRAVWGAPAGGDRPRRPPEAASLPSTAPVSSPRPAPKVLALVKRDWGARGE